MNSSARIFPGPVGGRCFGSLISCGMSLFLMVVHDLHVYRFSVTPSEADSVSIVNTNGILPSPVPSEFLQAIAWGCSEVVDGVGERQDGKFVLRSIVKRPWKRLSSPFRVDTIEYILGSAVGKLHPILV